MARRESTEVEVINASDVQEMPIGIIDPKTFELPVVENQFEDQFGTFASGMYLPRLSMEGSSSNLVKKGKVQRGHWVLTVGREEIEDLGEATSILLLGFRPKAIDMIDTKKVFSSYDPNSSVFQDIVKRADSSRKGLLYGLEFLVWVGDSKGEAKFATMLLGTPTARNAAKDLKPLIRTAKNPGANNQALCKWKIINNGTHIWEAQLFLPYQSPLASYPSKEEAELQMRMFFDPPKDPQIERMDEAEVEAAGTERER